MGEVNAFRRIAAVPLLVFAGAATLSGCGGEPGGGAPDPSRLVGNTYLSQDVTGPPVPGGGPLEVSFPEPGRISATAGCNRHNGSASFDGDTLTVGQMAATMMACPGDRMQADAWLAGLFAEPLRWSATGDTLTLKRGEQTVELARRADEPLTGTAWTVTSLVRNQGVETSVALSEAAPRLEIADDGRVTGFGGCNGFGGEATVTDETIDFGPLIGTMMACSPEINDVEGAVRKVLEGSVRYSIDGAELSLTNVADPGIGLRLRADQPS